MVGTNGSLPYGNKGRRKSSYSLDKKEKANGVIAPKSTPTVNDQALNSLSNSSLIRNQDVYSASYCYKSKYFVTPHQKDENTDMFQIGRSTNSHVDIVVMDIIPGSSTPYHQNYNQRPQLSTVSRYACRIICCRNPPHITRIFAGCYDSSKNMKVSGPVWNSTTDKIDGFHTKNGVLLLKNTEGHNNHNPTPNSKRWMEVSVSGDVYSLRKERGGSNPGQIIEGVDNILTDRTLIDLGGVILLWRSEAGFADSQPLPFSVINSLINQDIDFGGQLSDFAFPGKNIRDDFEQRQKPWVFLHCGHVHGWTIELEENNETEILHTCPECRVETRHVPLIMSGEPAFYVDEGPISHCFVPCGHVCSMRTARYWWQIKGPTFEKQSPSICPFCAATLETPGFLKLIWLNETYYNLVPKIATDSKVLNGHNTSLNEGSSTALQQTPSMRDFLENFMKSENIDIVLDTVLSQDD